MLKNIELAVENFTYAQKLEFLKAVVVMTLSALFEVLGIASVMPFIAILTNPEMINSNALINKFYNYFQIESPTAFIIYFGILVLAFFTISLIVKVYSYRVQISFVQKIERDLSTQLLKNYLNRRYEQMISLDRVTLGKNVLSEVKEYCNSFVTPLLNAANGVTLILFIITALLFVDYKITLITFLFIFISYFIIFIFNREILSRAGSDRFELNEKRFQIVNNTMSGYKEIKINKNENLQFSRFFDASDKYAKAMTSAYFSQQLPRFFLEGVMYASLVITIIYMVQTRGLNSNIIPTLSFLGLAAYRLVPAAQNLYAAIAQMTFGIHINLKLAHDLALKPAEDVHNKFTCSMLNKVQKKELHISELRYRYPGASAYSIDIKNLSITLEGLIVIKGISGSGKSTFIDILMGLLTPEIVEFSLDGKKFETFENLLQPITSYAPQKCFIEHGTILENINLTSPETSSCDTNNFIEILDFIDDHLPQKLDTVVGGAGDTLSGGQVQRIGLVRALSRQSSLLVLDEITSALDNVSEQKIMGVLKKLSKEKPIVMISHSDRVIENADQCYEMKNGNLNLIKTKLKSEYQ